MQEIDAKGLICPLPVLKARKQLLSMEKGEDLRILCSDANARKDFPLFCAEQGYGFIGIEEQENAFVVTVRK
jgi:tRNA 2-thiouridine synthesizing protein A